MKKLIIISISLLGFASSCEKDEIIPHTPKYGPKTTVFQEKTKVADQKAVEIPGTDIKENEIS